MSHDQTCTERADLNMMPWQIEALDGINEPCILVATMNGNEMMTVSLHVATRPKVCE